MPEEEQYSDARLLGVMLRGAINEWRMPRLCAARQCRRHKRCQDGLDGVPRCLPAMDPLDRAAVADLVSMAAQICDVAIAAEPAEDPVLYDQQQDAVAMLFDCSTHLPFLIDHLIDWQEAFYKAVDRKRREWRKAAVIHHTQDESAPDGSIPDARRDVCR